MNIKKYKNDVEYNRLEAFALVLEHRLRKLPFFDYKFNHIKKYRSGRELIFEVTVSEYCHFKYIFSFSQIPLEGKDWTRRKRNLTFFITLSQNLSDFSDRLVNTILYEELVHWIRGHSVERRAFLLIENYLNKKYKKEIRLGNRSKKKDMIFKYDLEIISKYKSFYPILIDIKSSIGEKEKAENQILNGQWGGSKKVHILYVNDADSDDRIIQKFEEIKKNHFNGNLISI